MRTLRNLGRGWRIVRTLGAHDATYILDRLDLPGWLHWLAKAVAGRARPDFAAQRPGQRLAAAVQAMGPSFIKFGQTLSTRADIVGEEIAADLALLRDRLPPFPTAQALAVIESELDHPIHELFASFEQTPVAAASIAQVHFAVTVDGEPVAVKVLRPGIEDDFERDIDFFLWGAELLERFVEPARRLEPVKVVKTFKRSVSEELDLRLEGAAASEMAESFAGDPTFKIPDVDWRRTQCRVLCTERVEGIPIADRAALLAAGRNLDRVVDNLLTAFLNQAFRDGFFHADLHHGNLFVGADDGIIAVDFGIMGRLDDSERRYVGAMLLAFLTGDYRRAAEVHFQAGYVRRDQSVESFAQALRAIAKPVFDRPPADVSMGKLLAHLFAVTEQFRMRTQPQLLLLQKTLVVVEGICRELAPHKDLWATARTWLRNWLPQAMGLAAQAQSGAEELLATVRRLPGLIEAAERAGASFTPEGLKLLPPDALSPSLGGSRRTFNGNRVLMYGLTLVLLVYVVFTSIG
ncbi:MAG: 2-polyprenylphenol 6-hydroxylase [Alphaproteobacteria bacterium]|nr:2-polyprenylphenol 6-hydroxylase [Alphaproteobacteria bacterium]